ncbi:MAG TPA: ABC transporter ATP-binding protein [Burkholderiales bacterium]|nr:ABC transporter ATP-binding protein [Burkholderiales bacterium]
MPEPVVRFRGVNKSFGRANVLCGIDFDIPAGNSMGLAGVNGAGKTTLIKCLLDFCDLNAGAIEIHGVESRRPQARKRLAYLPERFNPPYFLTGREFISMMLQLLGRRYDGERARAMFAALDLDVTALDKPVRAYSKGMTQKLGLAACFLSGRDLYVLDEPMSDLDPRARARVKELLAKLRSEGRTLFLTSHLLADIEEICDHMAVLHQGTLAYTGAPQGLCERYGEASIERAFLKCIEAHA